MTYDVIVIDRSVICRELLGKILEVQGYKTAWTVPESAMKMLLATPPALVVLEPGMGFFGWRLLEHIRESRLMKDLPVVLLTDRAEKEDVLRAVRLGVRDYMLKARFSLPELLIRVRRHVAPSGPCLPKSLPRSAENGDENGELPPESQVPATTAAELKAVAAAASAPAQIPFRPQLSENLTREKLMEAAQELAIVPRTREQTLERLEAAPVKLMPGVVADLISMVNSPRGTVTDIAHILRQDPALTAALLRVANSAAFASYRVRVPTVEEAVKIIGVSGVRNLVINLGVFDAFRGDDVAEMRVNRVWQHSLGVALLMEKLAPKDDSVPPGSAFLVGLCHDLAEIVLRQQFAEEYKDVANLVKHTGYHARHAEALVFGIPYGQVVSHLLARLQLPPVITLPIEELFERARTMSGSGSGSLLGRSLRALNVYAHGLLLAADVDQPVTPLTRDECEKTFCENALLAPAEDQQIRCEALATASAIAGLNAAQAQEACQQLVPQAPVRICYSPDEEYSKLDPLASLLRVSAKEVVIAPPLKSLKPDALDGMNGLIVAGPRTATAEVFARDLTRLRALVSGRTLPVLYLSGYRPPDDKSSVGNILVRPLPMRIAELGAFLGSISS